MKRYFLLKCFGGGNVSLAECYGQGMLFDTAISTLQVSCPVPLSEVGYAKVDDITYTVVETFRA